MREPSGRNLGEAAGKDLGGPTCDAGSGAGGSKQPVKLPRGKIPGGQSIGCKNYINGDTKESPF